MNLLGAGIGPEDDLLLPSPEHPTGSWQNASITQLNDRVLNTLGGSWQHPPALEPGWERDTRLLSLRRDAERAVRDLFGDVELVAWSDPRTSILLPFWQGVVPIAGTVLMLRDPAEVAMSLALHHQIEPEHAATLWLRYVTAAWLDAPSVLAIHYSDLGADLVGVAGAIASFIDQPDPTSEQLEAIRSFFDRERYALPVRPITPGPMLSLANQLYALLVSEREHPSGDVRPLFAALRDAASAQTRSAELGARTKELGAQVEALQATTVSLGDTLQAAESARDDARRRAVHAERELAALREEVASARRTAARETQRYEALRKRASVRVAIHVASRTPAPVRRLARRGLRAVRRRLPGRGGSKGGTADRSAPAASPLPDPRSSVPIDLAASRSRLKRLGTRPVITVIVPVFDAYEDLRRCVDSIERNTTAGPCDVLFIDDASTDPRVAELLDELEEWDNVRVLRNRENLGFTRSVNRGITSTEGDVVLLNTDCQVTPHWIENLAEAAYRGERIATVTAMSDNAGAFSVPDIGVPNAVPAHLSRDELGTLVTRTSRRAYPRTPTGNGFCLYIKRAAIDEVGVLDADRFPRGYGEEGDFCMRATEAGWSHVVDDATIVFHRRSASFGDEKAELLRAGRRRLDERHPEYTRVVREFVSSAGLAGAQGTVRGTYELAGAQATRVAPRVLYVHHKGTGGTPATTADLVSGLHGLYEAFVLTSDTRTLELSRTTARGAEVIERWKLSSRLQPEAFSDDEYRAIAADFLTRYAIDVVHIRVLLGHTFDLPAVARTLGIPVVLSFHDFHLVCPTVHLLDEQDRFCGGSCTEGDGACRIDSPWLRTLPTLKHRWVHVWQRKVNELLANVDAFVTTSPSARDVYVSTYPQLVDAPFPVIEHGRDLMFEPLACAELTRPVRIAIPGSLDVHKGARFIEELLACDVDKRLELHFLGSVPVDYRHLGVMHGTYRREEFAAKMRAIRPAFVGIFSIWPETYSHTLSEAWAAGLPALVTDLGAPKERVERHGGGWIVPHGNPAAAYERIVDICDDPGEYRRVANTVGLSGVRSRAEMAADYDRLYRSTLLNRRVLRPPGTRKRASLPRVAAFLPTSDPGRHPGSAHVRVVRRIRHPMIRRELDAEVASIEGFLEGAFDHADVALVQRTAIPAPLTDRFLEAVATKGVALVVDLDDDLFALDQSNGSFPEYEGSLAALDRLLAAADLLIVSTEALRSSMASRARRIEVVPNMLDELLWFGDNGIREPSRRRRRVPRCELLYVGTTTHARDIAILRPVLALLRERGVRARLSVVGGEPDGGPSERWYNRVSIPRDGGQYPEFVSWLRSFGRRWDIALAPLEATAFNRCKSDVKFLEYSALGLPGVYANLLPYEQTVEAGVTGLLADDDPGGWANAILRLVNDDELRRGTAGRAYAYVKEQRCLHHQAPEYARLLTTLLP